MEEEQRPKRPRLIRRIWVKLPQSAEGEWVMQVVREFTGVATQIFMESGIGARPAVVASSTDLQRAFNDLMAALSPADRATITQQIAGRPGMARQLDTSAAAVANARRLFTF
jgi:hypothetical protein